MESREKEEREREGGRGAVRKTEMTQKHNTKSLANKRKQEMVIHTKTMKASGQIMPNHLHFSCQLNRS